MCVCVCACRHKRFLNGEEEAFGDIDPVKKKK